MRTNKNKIDLQNFNQNYPARLYLTDGDIKALMITHPHNRIDDSSQIGWHSLSSPDASFEFSTCRKYDINNADNQNSWRTKF